MAIEKAGYEVVDINEDFELRRYQGQILAETVVEGEFRDASNQAFRRLFKYISGENRAQTKIAMTAPVVQERVSEEIEMTSPVTQQREHDGWRMAFMVPASYSWDTVPQPTDDRVVLREVPERLMAAVRFSGRGTEEKFESQEGRLLAALEEYGLRPVGKAEYARYDPPFMPWFLRRNEVLIPVEPVQQESDESAETDDGS